MPTLYAEPMAPPLSITALLHSRWATQALRTAVELNIFGQLADKPLNVDEIARILNLNQKATLLLLNALAAMDLLKKTAEKFELTETSKVYFVPESVLYFGNYVLMDHVARGWDQLTEVVRQGTPVAEVNTEETASKFFPQLAANIFPMNYPIARSLAKVLQSEAGKGSARVLDVGAGSAAWSIPFAEANKDLQVDAVDFAPVLETTRKFTERMGVSNQFHYLTGSWDAVALQPSAYDIVILGHLLHSEGKEQSQNLLAKMYEVLKPGGTLIVAEFLSNEAGTGPVFAQLFALNMLLHTTRGCVFTENELDQMVKAAGFAQPERVPLPFFEKESPIMKARKG